MVAPVVIRRAAALDAPALAALAARTFRDAFAADNTPDDMDAHCARAYSPAIQARELADAGIDTLVGADGEGQLVAYAQLRPGSPPVPTGPSPLELWRFYVDRGYHGHGIAQRLMASVIETARARAARTLWLGVWERNPRAQAFYRKIGFVPIGTQQFVVGADVQTDQVMALDLGGGP